MLGSRSSPSTQRRTGSLTVLVAWSDDGCRWRQFREDGRALSCGATDFIARRRNRRVRHDRPRGTPGDALVVVGVTGALPGFVRFLRADKWPQVRGMFVRSVVSSLVVVVATAGLSWWATI